MSVARSTSLVWALCALLSAAQCIADDKDAPNRRPNGKFTLGKETTYVNGPLDKDGYVDYVTALNERLRQGVTPENNANVLLWKAMGPQPGGVPMPPKYFEWMSITPPPENGEYFIELPRYMKEQAKLHPPKTKHELDDEFNRAPQRPWKAADYPHLAAWLKANEKPLGVVIEATQRPHYFSPLVVPRAEASMLDCPLSSVQKCREFAWALAVRAMLRLGNEEYDGAWKDLLACHRLGRLTSRGGTLIEVLVGTAIENVAAKGALAFVDRAELDANGLRTCLHDLQRLPAMSSVADHVDVAERFVLLNVMMVVNRDGMKGLEALSGKKRVAEPDPPADALVDPLVDIFFADIDWDPALRNANRWYDRLVAAMRAKDRRQRSRELEQLERDLKALRAKAADSPAMGKALLGAGNTPEMRGQLLGEILISLLLPAAWKIQDAAQRTEQGHRNLCIAFALAAYRRDHGTYPDALGALEPDYLERIPLDLFTDRALVYRPSDAGYLLYSFGPNRTDDHGFSPDDSPPGDDVSVRMPLPPLKRKAGGGGGANAFWGSLWPYVVGGLIIVGCAAVLLYLRRKRLRPPNATEAGGE